MRSVLVPAVYFCASVIARQQAVNLSATHSSEFFSANTSSDHFGLFPQYTWSSLYDRIENMSKMDDQNIYRLVMIGRHGEGDHNLAERKYGSLAWNDKWSKLNGDHDLCWGPDANLTSLGIEQAVNLSRRWAHEVKAAGFDWPTIRYASPLSRTINTARHIFGEQNENISRLIIMEKLRETIGVHTCDKRSSRSVLDMRFPDLYFTDDFSETDRLWSSHYRETDDELQRRGYAALTSIMSRECNTLHDSVQVNLSSTLANATKPMRLISITSHSGFIRNLMPAIDHYPVNPGVSEVIPMVVRATCQEISSSNLQNLQPHELEDSLDEDSKRVFLVQI